MRNLLVVAPPDRLLRAAPPIRERNKGDWNLLPASDFQTIQQNPAPFPAKPAKRREPLNSPWIDDGNAAAAGVAKAPAIKLHDDDAIAAIPHPLCLITTQRERESCACVRARARLRLLRQSN
jgi:hypothetical protein